MKTAIVPAQITTVEDRIAGNFTFSQLGFIATPIVLSAAVYASMTPKLQLSFLKLAIISALFVLICPLAIRVNGKTVAAWLVVSIRYAMRPRVYVHTVTEPKGRNYEQAQTSTSAKTTAANIEKRPIPESRPLLEHIRAKQLLEDPAVSVSFEIAQNGGIDVSLKPIKR